VGSASVTFAPWVDVCLGCEDAWDLFHTKVHVDALQESFKPWSSHHLPGCSFVTHEKFDYQKDLWVPIPELFAGFIPPVFNSNSDLPGSATCDDPLSLCEAVLIPGMQTTCLSDDSFVAPHAVDAVLSSGVDAHTTCGFSPRYADVPFCPPVPEWTSLTPIRCPNEPTAPSSSSGPAGHGNTDAGADSQQRAPSPIRLPLFAQQMMVNLPNEFLTNPIRIVQGLLVRTWYLHHVNIPRSLQARQIMLTGPPHLWRAQVLTTWNDLLIPGEDITLDLVNPAPPRNWHETSIVFDLILAQGLYAGRMSGLVSISPTITEPTLRMYALAVSFAPLICGQDVITESDVQPLCIQFDCLIFHARNQLYMDFHPVHHMTNGDSFVVYLSRRPADPSQAPVSSQVGDDPAPEPAPGGVIPMEADGAGQSQSQNADSSIPMVNGTVADQDLRRVTIYRLDRPSVSAWVRWRRFSLLLQDVLSATALSPSDLVAIHPLLVKPIGEHVHEISVIVQQLWDIAPGFEESLILLDTTFHQQGPIATVFAEPVVDRKVIKVPMSLTRLGLLHVARVANYCESVGDACLVSVNHELWNSQLSTAKSLLHGCYGRIQVPPTRVHGTETCRAVSLIEDLFDPVAPSFAQVYPQVPHHADVNVRPTRIGPASHQHVTVEGVGSSSFRQPRTCHFGDHQAADGPNFESPIPFQAAPVFPNAPDWTEFANELNLQFNELSVTEIPEEGPVLHVITWFVHHDRSPSCLIGRLVRLSHRPHEWFQLLCAPWVHLLQPFEALAFRFVRPAPPSHIPGVNSVHIILEQGLQQSRMTALFSAIFQGLHGDLTHRRAQSIPTVLSRDVITRILAIQDLCCARVCVAWSGRAHFRRTQLDPVFNGIGVSITVDAFRNRFANVDEDGYPLHDAASSSQVPARMSFRHDDATLFPGPESGTDDDDDCITEHAPSRLIPELRIIWERHLISTETGPYRFYVETWFCDHDRFPRTDRGREVLLPPDQESWKAAILQKWQDVIDPSAEVFLYVVAPKPMGGPDDILAHVLLAQHQHRGFVSALITTIAPGDDVWDPPRLALKLPAVVDKGLLLQESGLVLYCPPFMPFNHCCVSRGDQPVLQTALLPAQSGDSFLCTAEAAAAPSFSQQMGLLFEFDVHHGFQTLGNSISSFTNLVLQASHSLHWWTESIDALDLQIQHTQAEVVDLLAQHDTVSAQPANPVPNTESLLWNALRTAEEQPFATPVAEGFSAHRHLNASCIDALRDLWRYHSQAQGHHYPLVVQVWYVDHCRHPCCRHGRVVTLSPPLDNWPQAVVAPWACDIWPNIELHLHLVQSRSVSHPPGVHAHVILSQRHVSNHVAVLCNAFTPASVSPNFDMTVCSLPAEGTRTLLQSSLKQVFDLGQTAHDAFDIFTQGKPWPCGDQCTLSDADCLVLFPAHKSGRWLNVSDHDLQAGLERLVSVKNKFDVPQLPLQVPCQGFPVRLSLDAVLPHSRPKPCQPMVEHLSTLEWSRSPNWYQRVFDSLDLALNPVPATVQLTDATQNAVFEAMEGAIGPYDFIEIYVDGATSSVGAGWSFVVVVHSASSARLLGVLAGPVVLGDLTPQWLGASTVDNIAAELSALAAALAFVIQTSFPCPVLVRPDLSLSRLIAQELVTTVSNPSLAKLCRLLAAWVPANLEFLEVRGHSGNAWNDLADSLAKHVLENPDGFPAVCFGCLHELVKEQHDLDWSWLSNFPDSMQHCFPNLVENTVWQFSPSMRKVPVPACAPPQLGSHLIFQCKVATNNVLALDRTDGQQEIGRRTGARTLRLDHQLHAARFHIVGLQETRTMAGQYKSDHFAIFASGGEGPSAARLGCELWLHQSLPIMTLPDGTGIRLPECKCIALYADPRRLFVQIEHSVCQFTVIVLHAPCLGKSAGDATAPIDHVKTWWSETARIWQEVVTSDMICAFVDANATLATSSTEFFQDHHADATTAQSLVFEEFLIDHALYVPATFAAHHVGPSFTWTHSSGRRMRLDYVLLSHSLFQMVARSETMLTYDGTFSHEDHIPACVELSGWL
jgi:exonuclease III/ribonuclease HI